MKNFLFVILGIITFRAYSSENRFLGIYGDDNRHEIINSDDLKVKELSRSVVTLVNSRKLRQSEKGFWSFTQKTFQAEDNVCSHERFSSQPVLGFCSGFLISENKIVTAGHCIKDQLDCKKTKFVFDYKVDHLGKTPNQLASTQVYGCSKLVGRMFDSQGVDYAVVEIDKTITDRIPLVMSDNSSLTTQDEVLVIGHPSGLPMKVSDRGAIREINFEGSSFITNLDSYSGNSGSPVINAKTYEVEGILVRGGADFQLSFEKFCQESVVLGEDGGRGEEVVFISRIRENGQEPNHLTYLFKGDGSCHELRGNEWIRQMDETFCLFPQP